MSAKRVVQCEACGLAPTPAAEIATACQKLLRSIVRCTIDGAASMSEAKRQEIAFQTTTLREMHDVFAAEAERQKTKRR